MDESFISTTLGGKTGKSDIGAARDGGSGQTQATQPSTLEGEEWQEALRQNSERAANFLKALANPHRLQILCELCMGEKSVSELEARINLPQPRLSQQLARLREQKLVSTRRVSKQIFYSLGDDMTKSIIDLLHEQFCERG